MRWEGGIVLGKMRIVGDLIKGAALLLNDEGFFITESHYLLDILEDVQFDSIYPYQYRLRPA